MTEEESRKFLVSPGPHLSGKISISQIMYLVIIALLFPVIGAIYYFGIYVIFIIITSILTAIITEFIAKKLRKREFVMDGSAIITGLLLALILPPQTPLFMVVLGSAFSIAIAKEAFGGLGHNIFNPALVGRTFLTVSFAGFMTRFVLPVESLTGDAITSPTLLSESFEFVGTKADYYQHLFLGNVGGSLGETSVLLILIGGILLLAFRVINWRIPLFYIGTVYLFSFVLGADPVFHILAGGLMLGAFFMATDYVTGPLVNNGKIIFAVGCGLLTVVIRLYGGMPEGVAFSILLMNAFTPLIDRYTIPKPLGYQKPEKKKKKKKEKEAEGVEKKEENKHKKDEKPKKSNNTKKKGGVK